MNKKPIYKKWWFWLIIVAVVIFVPIIINEAYKTTIISDSHKYRTVWNPADTLAYYGTALSFVGTVILGALAFWQNERANEVNRRLMELEKKSKRGYFVPEHNIKADGFPRPVARPHYIEKQGISLICCGEDNVYVSKSVYVLNGRSVENDYGIFVTTEGDFKKIFVPIELNDEERKLDELKIDIVLYLENSRAYRYTQTLYLTFKKQKDTAYELCGFNSKFADDEV